VNAAAREAAAHAAAEAAAAHAAAEAAAAHASAVQPIDASALSFPPAPTRQFIDSPPKVARAYEVSDEEDNTPLRAGRGRTRTSLTDVERARKVNFKATVGDQFDRRSKSTDVKRQTRRSTLLDRVRNAVPQGVGILPTPSRDLPRTSAYEVDSGDPNWMRIHDDDKDSLEGRVSLLLREFDEEVVQGYETLLQNLQGTTAGDLRRERLEQCLAELQAKFASDPSDELQSLVASVVARLARIGAPDQAELAVPLPLGPIIPDMKDDDTFKSIEMFDNIGDTVSDLGSFN
jgi:hypothetical protein